ncbi:hypothetical protein Taro_035961 [Colocasia esculenta]|uniref:Uncharacterized protein n=1 Tax=Colocasia esculenta TaxID=4460 RepID=A0A843W0B1_COLES|nr:hypothetical protein [Colocasia esculenta]
MQQQLETSTTQLWGNFTGDGVVHDSHVAAPYNDNSADAVHVPNHVEQLHQGLLHVHADEVGLHRHRWRPCMAALPPEEWMMVQTFLCKRCVDTPINGVDTSTQIQREIGTQVDTLPGQVDTRPSSQNSQFEELGQQVDTLKSRSTRDLSPRTDFSIFGTVCRHNHQGRSTHYGNFSS